MLATILTAWSLGSLASRFYLLIGSLAALIVLAASSTDERPTALAGSLLHFLGADASSALRVAAWLDERAVTLGVVVLGVLAVSVIGSAVQVGRDMYVFDRIRGPSTFWIALLAAAQLDGPEVLRAVWQLLGLLSLLVLLLNVVGVFVFAHVGTTLSDRRWWLLTTATFTGFALALVPFWLPLATLRLFVGATPITASASASGDSPA